MSLAGGQRPPGNRQFVLLYKDNTFIGFNSPVGTMRSMVRDRWYMASSVASFVRNSIIK